MNREEIQTCIVELISKELKLESEKVNVHAGFYELGLDSVNSLFLLDDLEKRLQMDIDPMSLYDNPTIASLAEFIDQLHHGTG
jgi:acyl carrier protein